MRYPIRSRARRNLESGIVVVAFVVQILVSAVWATDTSTPNGWQSRAPRDEIRPQFESAPQSGREGAELLSISTDRRPGLQGWWQKAVAIEGSSWYRFSVWRRATNVSSERSEVFARVLWQDADGNQVPFDEPVVNFYASGSMKEATPEYPVEGTTDAGGWTELTGTYRAPAKATQAVVELHLQWATDARVEWSGAQLTKTDAPAGRRVRLAAVHYRPQGKTPDENRRQFAPLVAEAASQKADLVVLPEILTLSATTPTYVQAAEPIPGPSTNYFGELAKQHQLDIVAGLIERDAHLIYNVAVLIDRNGNLAGKYRKVCLPRGEIEAGVMPGDEYPVFQTSWGKLGLMVCYDGFFPEVARELANRGAEVIAFPVAGCNPQLMAARACENHVYLVSSTYTDVSQRWSMTGVYDHQGQLLAQADKWGTVVTAEVDLDRPLRWANLGDFRAQLPRHRPAGPAEIRTPHR